MAGGWSRDGAVQEQIDASVDAAVQHARSQLPKGKSLTHCEQCYKEIPQARRDAIPCVRLCIRCQETFDEEQQFSQSINRRGNKDSQLR